jgi:NAD(P)-dependent dehydrogenase (short-subunit alcohol dehydrogenase family)
LFRENKMNKKNLIFAVAMAAFASPTVLAEDAAIAASAVTGLEISINSALINEAPTRSELRLGTQGAPYPVSRAEVEYLAKNLANALEKELVQVNLYQPNSAAVGKSLRITINDLEPGAVQYTDAGFASGRYRDSFGAGGAALSAQLIGPDGTIIREYRYQGYSGTALGRHSDTGWGDADASMERFAETLAADLKEQG